MDEYLILLYIICIFLFSKNLSCGYFMCRLLINSNTQKKKIKVCFAMAPKQMLSYKQHTFGVFIFLVIIKYENYSVVFLFFHFRDRLLDVLCL